MEPGSNIFYWICTVLCADLSALILISLLFNLYYYRKLCPYFVYLLFWLILCGSEICPKYAHKHKYFFTFFYFRKKKDLHISKLFFNCSHRGICFQLPPTLEASLTTPLLTQHYWCRPVPTKRFAFRGALGFFFFVRVL